MQFPENLTISECLAMRAERTPEALAYKFLHDVDRDDDFGELTYRQLYTRVASLAGDIRGKAVTGSRAVLLYPPGLDYIVAFYACLWAGVVAIPAYPIRNNHNARRVLEIVRDCGARLLIAAPQDAERIRAAVPDLFAHGQDVHLLCGNDGEGGQQPLLSMDARARQSGELAFLQYTSGSTGSPKGVMVSHGNIIHNVEQICRRFEHNTESRLVSWLPPYHDMGLISAILEPLYAGYAATLMSPFDFLQDPYRWLHWVSRERATTTGGPNFAFDLCVDKISDEELATLDLSALTVMFNGAEPIRRETLERFAERFAPTGFQPRMFYPCYGLAEGTLFALGARTGDGPTYFRWHPTTAACSPADSAPEPLGAPPVELVGCGQSVDDQQVLTVCTDTFTVCAEGVEGEIWIKGPSVAMGYWGKLGESRRTFNAFTREGNGPFLRTGDLGVRSGDQMFVTGRAKDLIIVRGQNFYPQDIERSVEENVEDVKASCCVAFEYERAGMTAVGVVAEIERTARKKETGDVLQCVREAVLRHFALPLAAVVIVPPGQTFKTSSGKIQRSFTRQQFLRGDLSVWARWEAETA